MDAYAQGRIAWLADAPRDDCPYGNDPRALRDAAWAQPISMRGNQIAHEFQYAAAIIEADQRAAQEK